MLIWYYWPDLEGGAERQCRKLAHALTARGHTCLVLTHWPGRGYRFREQDGAVTIRRCGLVAPVLNAARRLRDRVRCGRPAQPVGAEPKPTHPPRRWFRPLLLLERMDCLSYMVGAGLYVWRRRRLIEVLHVHESHWVAGWGTWLGRRCGIPVLCKEITCPPLPPLSAAAPFRSSLERWRAEAVFTAQTRAIADALRERGVPSERITVLPNAVEIPADTAQPESNENVLFVGNFSQGAKWKAFDVLFDAWRDVHRRNPGLQLSMVGGGDPERWRVVAREHGFLESVVFTGRVADLSAFYRDAAMLVLPSRVEGMSNALLEAQSWGIPAIVSEIPGNLAVVEDGVNGVIVPVEDPAALADAILRLHDHPALRARMGAAARRHAVEKFAIDGVVDRLLELYSRLRGAGPNADLGRS